MFSKFQHFVGYILYFYGLTALLNKSLNYQQKKTASGTVDLPLYTLQTILDNRGVRYKPTNKGYELKSLLSMSGGLDKEEANVLDNSIIHITTFANDDYYRNEVKNITSVWLVKFLHNGNEDATLQFKWKEYIKLQLPWPIKYGVHNCYHQKDRCPSNEKGTSMIALLVPPSREGLKMSYVYFPRQSKYSIKDWIGEELAKIRIPTVTNKIKFKDWILDDSLKVVFLSPLPIPPTFLIFLRITYQGLVKFAYIDTRSAIGKTLVNGFTNIPNEGTIIFYDGPNTINYRRLKGAFPSYRSMNLFIKTLRLDNLDVVFYLMLNVTFAYLLQILTFNSGRRIQSLVKELIISNLSIIFAMIVFVIIYPLIKTFFLYFQWPIENIKYTWIICRLRRDLMFFSAMSLSSFMSYISGLLFLSNVYYNVKNIFQFIHTS